MRKEKFALIKARKCGSDKSYFYFLQFVCKRDRHHYARRTRDRNEEEKKKEIENKRKGEKYDYIWASR